MPRPVRMPAPAPGGKTLAAALGGVDVAKLTQGAAGRPLWLGPEDPGPMGGITQSMLGRFLNCRARFGVHYVDGLQPPRQFRAPIEFGQMWHTCEEALSAGQSWEATLLKYAQDTADKYRGQQDQVLKWYRVCKVLFPIYVDYWGQHPDNTTRVPVFQESVFHVPYRLESGRVVYLRGKQDACDVIDDEDRGPHLYLQENKTKGDIDEPALMRQLTFDLQTMFYLTALTSPGAADHFHGLTKEGRRLMTKTPLGGTRYNVIRRPLSGGKGSIKQLQPTKARPQGESMDEYMDRLRGVILEDVDTYFARFKAPVFPQHVSRFRHKCLDPILEQLCAWYDVTVLGKPCPVLPPQALNWQHPFGVYNVLDEGGSTDLDEYLLTGSTVGLEYATELFTEAPIPA